MPRLQSALRPFMQPAAFWKKAIHGLRDQADIAFLNFADAALSCICSKFIAALQVPPFVSFFAECRGETLVRFRRDDGVDVLLNENGPQPVSNESAVS